VCQVGHLPDEGLQVSQYHPATSATENNYMWNHTLITITRVTKFNNTVWFTRTVYSTALQYMNFLHMYSPWGQTVNNVFYTVTKTWIVCILRPRIAPETLLVVL